MIHEEFRELIILASLNELDDFNNHKLSEHLDSCPACKEEYHRMISFNTQISVNKKMPDADLLQKARRELRQNLITLGNKNSLLDGLIDFFFTYKLALGAISLFLIGIFTGLLLSTSQNQESLSENEFLNQSDVKINNISFIDSDLTDGEIAFACDAVRPVTVKGKISDSRIQQILAHSILNEKNDGVRLRAINTIASQTFITNRPGDKVKAALIKTVKFDQNPGVRREALIILNRLPFDQDIINALLYVLENDENAGLRIAAINSFDPGRLDSNHVDQQLINILETKSREDENEYIKLRAKTVLEEVTKL